MWANFQRIIELFNQNCQLVLKNMELGSRIRDPEKPIPDPGSRGRKGTVSHALSLPPPGIEPGLPASQAGTLPKSYQDSLYCE